MGKKNKGTFWKDFGLGFKSYGRALKQIFTTKLWLFLLVPLAINIALFMGGWELRSMLSDYVQGYLLKITALNDAQFTGAEFLAEALSWIISIAFGIIFFFVFAYMGGYIVIIVMSPILAYTSEKSEMYISGRDYPFDFGQLIKDIIRGILIALRNLAIETGCMIAVFIGTYIPVIGWIFSVFGTIIMFFVASYFYGFSFMDYAIERRRLTVRKSVKLVRKRKGIAVAIGMVFAVSLMIPFCGVILSSFVAVVSAIAGSIAMNEALETETDLPLYVPGQ